MERSGFYEIGCSNCEMSYIGQTKRIIEIRDKEHSRACRNKDKLLESVNNPFLLDAFESLHIARGLDLMNTGEPPIKSVFINTLIFTTWKFCSTLWFQIKKKWTFTSKISIFCQSVQKGFYFVPGNDTSKFLKFQIFWTVHFGCMGSGSWKLG